MNRIIEDLIKIEKKDYENKFISLANTFFHVDHPVKGRIKFKLYDFQEKLLKNYVNENFNIVNKSRQMGVSTVNSIFAFCQMLLYPEYKVLIKGQDKDNAKRILDLIRKFEHQLPHSIGFESIVNNLNCMVFNNRSRIEVVTSFDPISTNSADLIIVDEAAFVDDLNMIGILRVLRDEGKLILSSTLKKEDNIFSFLWHSAISGLNYLYPTILPWYLHPDRDLEWRKGQNKMLEADQASREYDCILRVNEIKNMVDL